MTACQSGKVQIVQVVAEYLQGKVTPGHAEEQLRQLVTETDKVWL